MSDGNKIVGDVAQTYENAKIFVGDFLYAPFGIESSESLNTITLFAIVAAICYATYRASNAGQSKRAKLRRKRYGVRRRIYY